MELREIAAVYPEVPVYKQLGEYMKRKATDHRIDRAGVAGLTPVQEPAAHEPLEKEYGTAIAAHDLAAAIDALVREGIARERAEELVAAQGIDWEPLECAAWPYDGKKR